MFFLLPLPYPKTPSSSQIKSGHFLVRSLSGRYTQSIHSKASPAPTWEWTLCRAAAFPLGTCSVHPWHTQPTLSPGPAHKPPPLQVSLDLPIPLTAPSPSTPSHPWLSAVMSPCSPDPCTHWRPVHFCQPTHLIDLRNISKWH
jgi:hypothetical protein